MNVSHTSNAVPFLPESAPFSPEQRAWLNGFFAGIFSENQAEPQIGNEGLTLTEIAILYGSQTGTAEGLARAMAKYLKTNSFSPAVIDLAEMDLDRLSKSSRVILITSTYGEGDPPDNAVAFYNALMEADSLKLTDLQYAVFGLGDTNYTEFCKCSREVDTKLSKLGAKRMIEAIACDGDPEVLFTSWKKEVVEVFGGSKDGQAIQEDSVSEAAKFDKKNPFPARLIGSTCLNGKGSSKETYHIELSLKGSGLQYEVGDALAVLPKNSSDYLNQFLNLLDLSGEESLSLNGNQKKVRDVLLNQYDINQVNPNLLKRYFEMNPIKSIGCILEDKEGLSRFCDNNDLYDLLALNADPFRGNAEKLIALLNPLKPRLYSISSSQKAHPEAVHLTVGKVSYEQGGRLRKGVCSCFLSEANFDAEISVYLHANKVFRLPADNEPIIMIGPGTGIAPFRAFLEEREQRQASGKNWLFFGDQHVATDFLYQDQLDYWLKHKLLTRLDTAFSRDQSEKIYVQNRILECGKEFFAWLEEGARIYVCGDASRMAKDVDQAIHSVIEIHGRMSSEAATDYVNQLKREKRYLRDVY